MYSMICSENNRAVPVKRYSEIYREPSARFATVRGVTVYRDRGDGVFGRYFLMVILRSSKMSLENTEKGENT